MFAIFPTSDIFAILLEKLISIRVIFLVMNVNNNNNQVLIVVKSEGASNNTLRAVRHIFHSTTGVEKVAPKVYLVPRTQWHRILQLVPRRGISLYYATDFTVLDKVIKKSDADG